MQFRVIPLVLALSVALVATPATRGELIEEIVAWVNGEVITLTDLQTEEQLMTAEAYRQFTGEELDRYVTKVKEELLLQMIDNKILVSRAAVLFDINKMREVLYDNFRTAQNIDDEEEFEKMLAREGLTIAAMKQRLLEMSAPEEVYSYEVGGRIAVSAEEVRKFYDETPEMFVVPGEVSIAEIVLLADTAAARDERRAEAEALRAQAMIAPDFSELAREKSEAGTATNGGKLGPLKREDLSETLGGVAFTIDIGSVSGLLEMPYGFHIITVTERTHDSFRTFEEVESRLRDGLEQQRFGEKRQEYMKRQRDLAEWCVKPRYRNRLSVPSPECVAL